MVPQQVLRISVVALAAIAAGRGSARADERVAIIDLRPGDAGHRRNSRIGLERQLATTAGIALIADDGVRAALGADAGVAEAAAAEALEEAAAAYGKLDCATAAARAGAAIEGLAAAQAGGSEVGDRLIRAYVYRLLCADGARDVDAAGAAAARLRALGTPEPPPGVASRIWDQYPELDATGNLPWIEIAVSTEPAGAEVWIDHQRAGIAPLTTLVTEGSHIVAAASDRGAAAQSFVARPGATKLTLAIQPAATTEPRLAAEIARWRGGAMPTPREVGALLDRLGVRFALVLVSSKKNPIEVWGVSKRGRVAQRLGVARRGPAAAAIVIQRAASWSRGPGIDPDRPLLRETPAEREARRQGRDGSAGGREKWWVYASIIGAVVLGGTVLLLNETADDRQRIEVTFP